MNKITLILIAIALAGMVPKGYSQVRGQQETDPQTQKLLNLSELFHQKYLTQRAEVERVAQEKGWMIRQETEQGVTQIIYIDEFGFPQTYTTTNQNAGRTTNTDDIWSGGSTGLNLTGEDYIVGEWDGGGVRTTHQEFDPGTGTRVTQMDAPASTHWHSTHVAGTIVAEGQTASAHGMATEALLHAYDWTDDESEMSAAASGGLTLSNHSYGWNRGWVYDSGSGVWYWYGNPSISATEDYLFGFYDVSSQEWDQIAYNAPNYLIVKSSGNDRNDSHTGGHYYWNGTSWVYSTATRDPDGGADGYDCIDQHGVAKNILTVGAVNDITGGWTSPADVVMSTFSSYGPTDDGRIKPDIVANGVGLYSCSDASNSSYTTSDGTSMSTPNTTGTLVLLQDYYESLRGGTMTAAALKGLVINTANEAGAADGPDYRFGWGLLNASGAANLITTDDTQGGLIVQSILTSSQTHDYTYYSNGSEINVTLCWTDPAGTPPAASLNPTTLMLVNDLDLRVIGTSTNYPWILNPASPASNATKGDNTRDNVETVNIATPAAGYYTVRVSGGTLSGGSQAYALIISGMTTPPTDTYCDAHATTWSSWEYISNVTMGSINNTTGRSPGGYGDYTARVNDITIGTGETLTVTINGYSGDIGKAWVDWNQDGDFTDSGEEFALGSGAGPTYSVSITPPSSAAVGYTTMRVRLSYGTTLSSCGTTSYGETEDYTLNVISNTNVWTGAYNYYWHNNNNWSLGHIPLADEDVIITTDGYHPPNVDYYNEECGTLTINAGAGVNIAAYSLTVNGDINCYGSINLTNTASVLRTYGNLSWGSGSSASAIASAAFYVQGNWEFASGANVYLDAGYTDFFGSDNSYIRSMDNDSYLYHVRNNKTTELGHSAMSTFPCRIKGNVYIYASCNLTSYSSQEFRIGNFVNNMSGTIHLGNGTFVFDGASGTSQFMAGDYFNNLTISSSGTTTFDDNIQVNGNLVIESGALSTGTTTLTLGGNWTNNVGASGFVPGTGTVVFNSLTSNPQDAEGNNTFYNVQQVNTGEYLRFNNTLGTLTTIQNNLELHNYCWAYQTMNINGTLNISDAVSHFTSNGSGNVTVGTLSQGGRLISNAGGTITVNDLVENGLFGSYYIITAGGVLDITNSGPGTWVDLNGEIHITDGTMNVSGSVSEWPYSADALIEMSGGVLDFKTCGITINDNANSLTDNITGGIIRTAGGFSGNRADFTPLAGTFEFYGTSDASMSQSNGSTLYNVNIAKGAKEEGSLIPKVSDSEGRIDKTMGNGSKSNTMYLASNFTITHNLNINSGTFDLFGHTCNVTGNTNIYGTLAMTSPSCDLINDGGVYWQSGSNDNVTSGTFHSGLWQFIEGTNAMLGTGNTAYLKDMSFPTDNDAEFGNLVVVPFSKNSKPETKAYYPTRVAGNFTIQNGANWSFPYDLIVAGNAVIENGASLTFYDGGDYYVTGNLDLSGTLILEDPDCMATIHSDINFPSTGILTIADGAGFICDYDAVSGLTSLNGRIDMSGSALFEMSGRSVSIGSTFNDANILGGTMRFGRTLDASVASNFQLNWGTVEFISSNTGHYVYVVDGNYLNHMIVDKPSGTLQVYDDLNLNGDLTINSGNLNSYSHLIYIKGDWTNNVGASGFTAGTGTVYFNGDGALNHQFISGTNTFYNLTNAKTGGGHLQPNGITTVNNNYLANGVNIVTGTVLDVLNTMDLSTGELGLSASAPNVGVNNFTMGGILSVTNGNFTCTDVTNNGIFGTISMDNGSITLNQDAAQFPDLNASVTISGGYMAVNGGSDVSIWGWSAPCNLTMTNGVLDFNNNGISLSNSFPFTENISGGTIKTDLMFFADHVNFTPTGGTLELYGGTDALLAVYNTANLFNLLINKSGGKDVFVLGEGDDVNTSETLAIETGNVLESTGDPGRIKFPESGSKANTVYTSNAVRVNGTTTVEEGTFLVDDYTTTCMNNITVNAGGKLSIGSIGTLAIENGMSLTVNNGGSLDLTGTPGADATITRNSGYYALNVENGGTIGAVYGTFEYMNTSGVNVKTGALVDNLKPFNYCTFKNGQTGGTLLTVNNSQTFYVENAIFPANTWTGASNVTKSVNSGMVYFVTATGDFAGESFDNDPNSRIMWINRSLALKAYLEGPFNGTNMNTTLNGILPLSHPFNPALPYFDNPMPDWRYIGAGSVAAIPNVNIVDWVLVELRDAVSAAAAVPATSIAKFPAFILNNGNIVGLNGSSNLEFTNVVTNNLYVVIYNRNHQGIMNASPVPYAAGAYTYDYTTGAAQVYGSAAGHKELSPGVWGMRSGDGNGDGDVLINDKTQVWGIPTQLGKTGYLPSDFSFDRQTNNKDKNDKWLPNNNTYSQVPN